MLYSYILIGFLTLTSLLSIVFLIFSYTCVKMLPHFSPTFEEYWEKDREQEWQWAKKTVERHYRYIGFRIYTVVDTETNQWHKELRFQWLKKIDKKLITWKINKPDWWMK